MDISKNIIYVFILTILICCKDKPIKIEEEKEEISSSNSVIDDIISNLSEVDTIPFLDLSKKDIETLPDLSNYKIKSLNLSNNAIKVIRYEYLPKSITDLNFSRNNIDTIIGSKIPNSLEHLNFSANNLKSVTIKLKKGFSHLKEIDLSSNKITYCYILADSLRHLDLSNNKLVYLHFNPVKQLEYLNISDNTKFSNITEFDPKLIDTIIKDNIVNEKPLIPKWKTLKNEPIE